MSFSDFTAIFVCAMHGPNVFTSALKANAESHSQSHLQSPSYARPLLGGDYFMFCNTLADSISDQKGIKCSM